jgi:hypothetical protein
MRDSLDKHNHFAALALRKDIPGAAPADAEIRVGAARAA